MIEVSLIVWLNNIISILVTICCFVHALHSGIHTNNFTKLVLYVIGIGFVGSIVDINTVVMPGYKYIMMANIALGLAIIAYSTLEARRYGYLQRWAKSMMHLMGVKEDDHACQKK